MLILARHRGVTLIEMLIGLAVVGLLMSLAMPAFQHWTQNAQIRNAAEGVMNGLQLARAEAVRRNLNIQIVVDGTSGWVVSTVPGGTVIQQRSGQEGSRNTTIAMLPAGATSVTFNGMGWLAANNDGSPLITQIDVTSATVVGPEIRALRVTVGAGGVMKMCDPAVAAGDPRACP